MLYYIKKQYAFVVKLADLVASDDHAQINIRWGGETADALALGASAERHVGSSPTPSTTI